MDVISAIITALVSGATTAATETASQAVKDGYAALKNVIGHRLKSLDLVTSMPDSPAVRAAAVEEAQKIDLGSDPNVVDKARVLNAAIASEAESRLPAGIDLASVKAASDILILHNKGAVRLKQVEVGGTIRIEHNSGN